MARRQLVCILGSPFVHLRRKKDDHGPAGVTVILLKTHTVLTELYGTQRRDDAKCIWVQVCEHTVTLPARTHAARSSTIDEAVLVSVGSCETRKFRNRTLIRLGLWGAISFSPPGRVATIA